MKLNKLIDHVRESLMLIETHFCDDNRKAAWEELGTMSVIIQDELPDCEPPTPAPKQTEESKETTGKKISTETAEASEQLPPGEAKVDKSGCADDAPPPEQVTGRTSP